MSAQSHNFKNNIFISYSHIDKDWVDDMHKRLKGRLTEMLGEEPHIWRDINLKSHEHFAGVLVVELLETAFLVSVLSPGYVKSEWCLRELDEFCRNAAKYGGIRVNNKSRIFKVIKSPIEDFDCPPILRDLLKECLDYEFYEREKLSGKLREFRTDLGEDSLLKFYGKLEDLIFDIRDFVKCQPITSPQTGRESKIYLAETTPDLSEERNEIKRTLQYHGYRVLPDDNLPFENSAFEEKVKWYLDMSLLSIHLIGSDHTVMPVEEQLRSRLNLQHQLAAERVSKQHELAMNRGDNDPQYSRLIWMPEGLQAQDASYQQFLSYLQNDPGVYEGADVLSGTKLEDFKTIIQKRLKYQEESAGDGLHKRIYVICDKQDLPAVTPLRSYLENELKYEVLLPFKESSEIVSGHKDNLRLCDAVLIFYGSTNTINYKLKDLRRIDYTRDNKPLLAKGIYVSGPETEHKRDFRTDEALVMKNFGGFSPESIKPLLEVIERPVRETKVRGVHV